ncbi:hypothetical protein L1987_49829 [Smallanthus sonchifolius]|uniref:Uncharacterized protein n=1 Tax=Smallanthus sonchifolius TaxID=185202 RepID=A0ACB9FWC7_9ASTR|nr:hypothetical protein L1987_49829 [Smallanthus sonchifolius]
MGACFSSQNDEQHSLHDDSSVAGEIEPSSTKDANSDENSESNVVVISKDVQDLRKNPIYSNLDVFTYDEMKMATKFFREDDVLGGGGFGLVYKGIIDESVRSGYTTTEVAIKELNTRGIQGDKEWLTEVNYLGYLQHPNLVKLIGYCCEGKNRHLVYEYMAGGSVEKYLFQSGCKTLTWSRRMKIALDAAKGHLATYCDTYAFGVVLLELLIGRRAVNMRLPYDEVYLADWVRPILAESKKEGVRMIDHRMKGQYSYKTAFKVIDLAYTCIRRNPRRRPLMSKVVETLESVQTHDIVS